MEGDLGESEFCHIVITITERENSNVFTYTLFFFLSENKTKYEQVPETDKQGFSRRQFN